MCSKSINTVAVNVPVQLLKIKYHFWMEHFPITIQKPGAVGVYSLI